MSKEKKIGILFGTFDFLHKGHLNLFRQAKKKCDYLIVVVARDKTVKKVKGKLPVHNESKRLNEIKKLKLIDHAILGSLIDKFAAIKKYKPDTIFLGYDQRTFTDDIKSVLKRMNFKTNVTRLRSFRPDIYKSSKIKIFKDLIDIN